MTVSDRPPVRVLLVDDEPLILSGFRHVLRNDEHIDVVADARDGSEAIEKVRMHQPDVVLMDIRMPGMSGIEATSIITQQSSARVLAVTSLNTDAHLLDMLIAGATGYLLKTESPAFIIDAVHRTAAGEAVFSGPSAAKLARQAVANEGGARRREAVELTDRLTPREREVAQAVARGYTNHQIGAALHISPGTVKTHLEQVFNKFGVDNRVRVGIILERAGLGPADL